MELLVLEEADQDLTIAALEEGIPAAPPPNMEKPALPLPKLLLEGDINKAFPFLLLILFIKRVGVLLPDSASVSTIPAPVAIIMPSAKLFPPLSPSRLSSISRRSSTSFLSVCGQKRGNAQM